METTTGKEIFEELSSEALRQILSTTIKEDNINKIFSFLCCLAAYTKDSQLNLSFNAPSSSGKSYIPLEVVSFFPKEDVIIVAYCSPTAFFHDKASFDKEKSSYLVNLEHKILVFLDQPHNLLLQHLRPILSHDEKEIHLKITDKSQRHGLKTKNVVVRGFASFIFCTAGLRIDEQEATRFILLSPETSQKKLKAGIRNTIQKETDFESYQKILASNPQRKLLMDRIQAIKAADIKEIKVHDATGLEDRFFSSRPVLKPRHQRDVKRLIAIAKSFALLNFWRRKGEEDGVIITRDVDIDVAFKIWDEISESQELNLPPYLYSFYQEIILPLYKKKSSNLSRSEVLQYHFKVRGRPLPEYQLRREYIPMLEAAGLIAEVQDPQDKRSKLIQTH